MIIFQFAASTDDEAVPAVAVVSNGANRPTPPNKIFSIVCLWDCCNCCTKFREICSRIVFDPFFQQFIIMCLLFDVANMACDHHNMEENFARGVRYFWMVYHQ